MTRIRGSVHPVLFNKFESEYKTHLLHKCLVDPDILHFKYKGRQATSVDDRFENYHKLFSVP